MIGGMLLALSLAPFVQDARAEPPSLARFPDWGERDAEGRWALFARDLAQDDDAANAWQPFLAEVGAHTLLEWIVMTQPKAWSGARSALARADAPQWIRASVFRLASADSHAAQNAKNDLTQHAGAFLGWLGLHPEARRGAAATLADGLDAAPNRGAAAAYLAPLSHTELFGALAAEAPVEFGDALTAAPGVVYVQAVERAIATVAATSERSPILVENLLAVALGPNPSLAAAACLAFTHFPAQDIPDGELATLAKRANAPPAVRELAFLAASYGRHPRAWVRLHLPALDPTHPHWRAALSRLAEVGDAFTVDYLAPLAPERLAPIDRELLEVAREQIAARLAQDTTSLAAGIEAQLERAAWADLTCAPIEMVLVRWTLDHIRPAAGDDEVHSILTDLASGYEPTESVGTSITLGFVGGMQPRVRMYARRLLAE